MPERNWAENDRRLETNPTPEECRKLGAVHKAYGWSSRPFGGWSDECVMAYREGYNGK